VAQIRAHWPHTRIILRADSGFALDALMGIFGLARNQRLVGAMAAELAAAQEESQQTGQPARRFRDFTWSTRESWSRERRVIAKAEWTQGRSQSALHRYFADRRRCRHLNEDIYCARGMSDRLVCRLHLDPHHGGQPTPSVVCFDAYVLVEGMRRLALQSTDLAEATCGTIRRKLFKVGALVTISVRRIKFAMASGCPYKAVFATAHRARCAALNTA